MALQTKTFTAGGTADTRYYSIQLKLTEESVSTAGNTSSVAYEFSIHRKNSGVYTGPYYSWTITIGGKSIPINNFAFNIPTSGAASQVIASGRLTIPHDADGGKVMSFQVYTPSAQDVAPSYGPPEIRLTGTWTLTAIPRASSVSAINGDIGSATIITISRASSAFTHTLTYAFGSLSGTIATKTGDTTLSWTVPTSFYAQIPKAKSGKCTITCETFSGSTSLGKKTTTFTVTASEALCKPSVSGTVVSTDALSKTLTGGTSKLIRYVSTARATITATAKNSATISKRTVNGQSLTTTKDFAKVETGSFVFAATDSRGYSNSATKTASIIQYVPLTLTPTVTRLTPTGDKVKVSVKGNYWTGNFGAVSNTLTLSVQYKKDGGTFGTATAISNPTISGTSYSGSVQVPGIDYREGYVFRLTAGDCAMEVTREVSISAGVPVFDWGKSDFQFNVPVKVKGKTLRIDTDSESSRAVMYLSCKDDFASALAYNPTTRHTFFSLLAKNTGKHDRFILPTPDPDLAMDGYYDILTSKNAPDYVIAQGSSGNWWWRKWNSGVAECWQRYSYETVATVGAGNIFFVPQNIGGFAYPFEFIAKPTELVSCDGYIGGWYATAHNLPTNTTTESGYYNFFSALSRPSDWVAMNIHVTGRWK